MTPSEEARLRQRLGIPQDAQRVLIFAESSHWDPNWLQTSDEYYVRFVEPNLDQAIAALTHEPRRVYAIECVFFLRMYWERRPDQQETVRHLLNEGRLRLTSSGVTTADTLLPRTEAILRDLLVGQEWLRHNGMTQEPRLAYFTDSFGCSPALPSLLQAAGFDRTAITRIDGMHFPGCDLESARSFPRPGSSAELLLNREKSLDFIWRDGNGAEVLCHWNAFTYGQGDMLAHRGIMRMYLFPLAIPDRSERHVANRVQQYVAQLEPYSRTPYLFCPIGFDFVPPIPDLVALLDRHNRVRYPNSGVWVLNAGLDDYLALVACHREALPVLELDPNPYWTGFYTARPALKKRCHDLVDRLLLAEQLALAPESPAEAPGRLEELDRAWWQAVVANHHDFITGTSPDAVVVQEQLPWLQDAQAQVEGVIRSIAPPSLEAKATVAEAKRPCWERQGDLLRVTTPHYVVELSESFGGGILSASKPGTRNWLPLSGLSNELISFRDTGGLWRMGHEYRGGALEEAERASRRRAPLQLFERGDVLEVVCVVYLDGAALRRRLWFCADSPLIYGRVEGRAPQGRTVTLRFFTGLSPRAITMAQPGGVVSRPLHKLYDPTFWPLQAFAHLQDPADGHGLAFFVQGSGAIACREGGRVELVALRNATRERAFGLIPLLANPASGFERERHAFEYALLFTDTGDWRANRLPSLAQEFVRAPWETSETRALHELATSLVTVEGAGEALDSGTGNPVSVVALKPASRGQGLILRLSALDVPENPVPVRLRDRVIQAAYLCDARERDLAPLRVENGRAYVALPGSIATLRLMLEE